MTAPRRSCVTGHHTISFRELPKDASVQVEAGCSTPGRNPGNKRLDSLDKGRPGPGTFVNCLVGVSLQSCVPAPGKSPETALRTGGLPR